MPQILDEGGGRLLDEGGADILDELGLIPTGSWWQLLDVRKHAQEEFEFYANSPPMSCWRCGEPLLNAPPTDAGSDVELYCRFDGWQYPRDWIRPQQL